MLRLDAEIYVRRAARVFPHARANMTTRSATRIFATHIILVKAKRLL